MNAQQALGWALVHFTWQGTVVALLTWMALRLMSRPQWRYLASAAAMTVMALAPVFTFLVLHQERVVLDIVLPVAGAGAVAGLGGGAGVDWLSWLTRAWMAGALLLSARSAGGWWVARRRCRGGIRGLWGTRGGVPVYESAWVAVPQVFGWLRPMILLPFSAVSGLTPEQLEAVIEHELAHVRRQDYLVNLLQTAVESLLFYHPAVWWVSREMRRDRELCCDEAAVARCRSRVLYSTALLRLEESRVEFAMAAAGSGLQERIGRLLGMEERKTGMAPLLLVGGALVICGATIWAQQPTPQPAPIAPAAAQAPAPKPEPAPKAKQPRPAPAPSPAEALSRLEEKKRALELQAELLAAEKEKIAREQERALERSAQMQEEKARMEQLRTEMQEMEKRRRQEQWEKQIDMKRRAEEIRIQAKEIERRIWWVESMYGADGLKTDRGKLYLKLGPPDEIDSHPGVRESWRYNHGATYEFDANGKLVKTTGSI